MRGAGVVIAAVVVVLVIAAGFYFIDIDMTEEAELPEVEMDVEGGQAPEFDAETGDVDVGTTETEVTVPDVEVTTDEETVTVPDIDVEPAGEAGDDDTVNQ